MNVSSLKWDLKAQGKNNRGRYFLHLDGTAFSCFLFFFLTAHLITISLLQKKNGVDHLHFKFWTGLGPEETAEIWTIHWERRFKIWTIHQENQQIWTFFRLSVGPGRIRSQKMTEPKVFNWKATVHLRQLGLPQHASNQDTCIPLDDRSVKWVLSCWSILFHFVPIMFCVLPSRTYLLVVLYRVSPF